MKSAPTSRPPIQRLLLLTVVCAVAVAALLGIAVSASKANRAAKARAGQAANTKSGINPTVQNDKQPNAPAAAVIVATLTDNIAAANQGPTRRHYQLHGHDHEQRRGQSG